MIVPVVASVVALWATAAAQNPQQPTAAGWQADLRVLAEELPRRHSAPFANITRAQWDSAVGSLERRLPALSRNQSLVELFRLVALLGDAHTNVQPNPSLGLHYYPLELYAFEDGLFVRRADSAHADLVGAKVLRIGTASADQALSAAAGIIPHENEWWVRAWAPFWLMIPEMLDGLGLASDTRVPLVIDRRGRIDTVVVTPAGQFSESHGPVPIDMRRWISMRQAAAPLWEQRPDQALWWTVLPDSHTLYVCMRAVVPGPRSGTNRGQWDEIFATADTARVARLVIDIRENLGGNGGLNRYPIQQILRRPALDRPDRLFVIIGRRTFSAGQQFANLLEWWTQATLVGEPTGQRPSQYGDHRPLVLPSSHLTVNISTVFHQAPNEFDERAFVPPAIYAPLSAAAYRTGVDPAMIAVLEAGTAPSAAELVERAMASGDTAEAERVLRTAQQAVANRFRSLEGEVNALGYRLLAADTGDRAIAVFRLNTRVYPRSANTYDSLGEAQLGAGRRADAITAYRKALEIDPQFSPSVEALRRLGALPAR